MLKSYYPYEYVDSVFAIDYQKLYKLGYRALIFDIDNTLVHHGDDSNQAIDDLFKRIHAIGFKTLLLSNNSVARVTSFIKNIDTLYICNADKPNPSNYYKAIKMLKVNRRQAICIGDQVFTDILGANKSGIASILVKFIRLKNETRIGKRRQVEKVILMFYKLNRKYCHRFGNITKKGDK